MPKLAKAKAKAVDAAESINTELVEEGIYTVELKSVETKTGKESGQPYWLWTFEIPADADEHGGKRFWLNTSLQDNALWKLKEVFEAFGETPETDTDTLIGEQVRIVVSARPIGAGPKMGQMSNQVENVLTLDEGEDGNEPAMAAAGAGADEDPPF